MSTFVLGDMVSIHAPYNGGVIGCSTVIRITARKITLKNKSAWRVSDNTEWGTFGNGSNVIKIYRPGDAEQAKQRGALSIITNVDWTTVPLEKLQRIVKILNEY